MTDRFIWFDGKFPWQVYLRITKEDANPRIIRSAYKHGCSETDILHAWRFSRGPIAIDEGTPNSVYFFVGPAATGMTWLELGVVVPEGSPPLIIHAMRARPKYLRRAGLA